MGNPNWAIDTKIALAINRVAEKTGLSTKQIREVVTNDYFGIKEGFTDERAPILAIKGIGSLRPVPLFIKRRLKKLKKSNSVTALEKTEELQEILIRVEAEREKRSTKKPKNLL
ncbi:MAG: hypothetical protein IT245_06730 [Bacteroidia bacterium]|nr:hypothetical protein [Bacteroidia bacterium]